jgi:hypothetical protein
MVYFSICIAIVFYGKNTSATKCCLPVQHVLFKIKRYWVKIEMKKCAAIMGCMDWQR